MAKADVELAAAAAVDSHISTALDPQILVRSRILTQRSLPSHAGSCCCLGSRKFDYVEHRPRPVRGPMALDEQGRGQDAVMSTHDGYRSTSYFVQVLRMKCLRM